MSIIHPRKLNPWDGWYLPQALVQLNRRLIKNISFLENDIRINCPRLPLLRHIFEMVVTRKNLWLKMTELEARATEPGRYHNRGGQLLREEKERKAIASNVSCYHPRKLRRNTTTTAFRPHTHAKQTSIRGGRIDRPCQRASLYEPVPDTPGHSSIFWEADPSCLRQWMLLLPT